MQQASSESPMDSKEYFDREVKLYELYRDYIKAEDLLRNSRTTTFLTIQGLLFTALGVTVGIGTKLLDQITLADILQLIILAAGLASSFHMRFRDSVMRTTVSDIRKRISKIKKSRDTISDPNLIKLVQDNAFWLNHFPKWHYASEKMRGGKWLNRLSYHNIFMAAWTVTLISVVIYLVRKFPHC